MAINPFGISPSPYDEICKDILDNPEDLRKLTRFMVEYVRLARQEIQDLASGTAEQMQVLREEIAELKQRLHEMEHKGEME